MSRTPRVTIIAGPNGAGKSTVAPLLLRTFGTKLYVNADTIAQGLAGLDPERAALAAGRIMLLRLKELAHEQADFAFETTLASRSFVPFIRALHGYESTLLFLYLRTPELAVQRVAERIQAGGHHVPKAVIERRYTAGLYNFFRLYLPVVDNWSIWDASSTGKAQLIAQQNKNSQTGATLIDNPLLWQQLEATYGS